MLDHPLHHLAHDTTCSFTSETFIAAHLIDVMPSVVLCSLLTLTHIAALKAPTERDAADYYHLCH